MNFLVKTTPDAEEDIDGLFDDLIDRAMTVEDLAGAERANIVLGEAIESLATVAPRCRKVDGGQRELIIPFGATGYIALFRIEGDAVCVLALRHQRESDYH